MNINDLLIKDVMIMDLQATDKKGAIDEMVQKLYDGGRISDIDTYKEGILKRSTNIDWFRRRHRYASRKK